MMTTKEFVRAVFGGLALVLAASTPLWAQADQDEVRLQTANVAIDKDAASKGSAIQVQTLSKQFNVPSSQIESMRTQKQGWGEITIQLAMAQHLTQTNPASYPTLNDALAKIQTLRSEQMGWGKIARDLGFKLGPVVRDAEQARQDLAKDLRAARTEQVTRQERSDRPDRPTRPERSERPERAAHR